MRRGIDTGLFHPSRRARSDSDLVVGYVGRLMPEKNLRLLMRVESALRTAGLVRMVLGQGLKLGAIGVAAGLVVSVAACRAMTSATWFLTFDQVNPLLFAVIALLLLAITTLAAWAPARHASWIDPMRALRDE
jgi:hypothetical protein